jgi:hypothetical protein
MLKRNDNRHRRSQQLGRLLAVVAAVFLMGLIAGCDEDPVDTQSPAVPTGVFTVTGNGVVYLYWNDLDESDLAGYAVYRHDGDDPEYGPYEWLADVAWDENYDADSLLHWYDDESVANGRTYYYAVLSYDTSGNESTLSYEIVFDTPRPSGTGINLYDRYGSSPERSGFDFSRLADGRQGWDEPTTDIYLAFDGGIPFVFSARPDVVELQDFGTVLLDWVDWAPSNGYSAIGRAELIAGHSYVVKVTEDPDFNIHYAKFQVIAVRSGTVEIDWAYQVDNFNPELRAPGNAAEAAGPQRNAVVRY